MGYMDSLLNSLQKSSPANMDELKKEKEKYAHITNPLKYEEANKIVREFYSTDSEKATIIVRTEVVKAFSKRNPNVRLRRNKENLKSQV
ncbi:hypothetical protein [Bacillus sp. KH172YL63]|uniref:hypothetical protein n=1 Tax=Bacillus sp. KH172YL63 TaxID=2709784 RepID=UPI0013E4843E|nr:hypothetical protein [Bacillus sp. KH172YL63]BCB05239.1 hypothetical protein KH172YL63_33720 [Bacillus sp. KH172YL63]